jgi:hypothetical protein
MDINALASEFGSTGVSPDTGNAGIDINGLAAEFGSKKKADEIAKLPTDRPVVYIVKPPISDATPEQSDAINAQPGIAGGANPRSSEPFPLSPRVVIPNVGSAIANQAVEGAKNFSGGLGDIVNQGQLGAGAKRMGVGALQAVTAIPAGIISGAVTTPITQLTGSPDIGDRAGFVASSAIPILPGSGAILGKPLNSIVGTVNKANPSNVALKDLIEIVTNKGANPENLVPVIKGMKANPRLGPADLNPAVLSATQKLFTTEGDAAKNYLHTTSANRMATTKDTISGAFDSALGKTVNAAQKIDELKAAARKVGKENIQPILDAKPHTDVTDLIKHIDSEIGYPAMKAIKEGKSPPIPLTDYQRELLNVRGKLRNASWPDRDKMFAYTDQVHEAQIALREKAQGLASSATGSERNTAKDLFKFREKLKDTVGPEYKEALGKYAGEKKIEEAFHYGHDKILANGKNLENDPSFFEKWVNSKDRKPGEVDAAKEGARLAINAEINGTRSAATNPASKAIGIGQVEFNRQRLTTLLGKEEADKLLTSLEHARLEANTHSKVFEGSQTAMRLASESKVRVPEPTPPSSGADKLARLASWVAPEAANFYGTGYAIPGIGLAASIAANTAHKYGTAVKDKVKIALAKERNLQLAKNALPTEGPRRDALIKSLEAAIPGPKQSIMRRGASTLSRLVAP